MHKDILKSQDLPVHESHKADPVTGLLHPCNIGSALAYLLLCCKESYFCTWLPQPKCMGNDREVESHNYTQFSHSIFTSNIMVQLIMPENTLDASYAN